MSRSWQPIAYRGYTPIPIRRTSRRDRQDGREGGETTIRPQCPRSNWLVIYANPATPVSGTGRKQRCPSLGWQVVVASDGKCPQLFQSGREVVWSLMVGYMALFIDYREASGSLTKSKTTRCASICGWIPLNV